MARKAKGRSLANGEQTVIDELAPRKIPAIHSAAKRYAERRDERMAANKEEKEAHETLLEKMRENGLDNYEYGDLTVHVDKTTKCKVKVGTEPSANGDGEDE